MSLYFLPSMQTEAARQDSKSRRALKPLEKMTMFIGDLLSLTHIFTAVQPKQDSFRMDIMCQSNAQYLLFL